MRKITLNADQLRRIICQLRRQLASLKQPLPSINRDASRIQLNTGFVDLSTAANVQVRPNDPRRVTLYLNVFGGFNVWASPQNPDIYWPGHVQDGLWQIDKEPLRLYAYREPALVKSEWWVSSGAVNPIWCVFAEEIDLS